MSKQPECVIAIDSREQLPYSFTAPSEVVTLPVGDYSIRGLESRVAIERKSLSDLLSSITHHRTRFEKELAKAKSYDFFSVVVEGNAADILLGRYRADVHPTAAWESLCTFTVRHCPVLFLQDRSTAARWVESTLLKYSREHFKATESMMRAARLHAESRPPAADQAIF